MNLFLRNPWLHMLGRRGLQVVALALIIGTLCFFMVRALPGDLAMRVAASRYGLDLVSGAAADTVRAELGLDQSAWQGLLGWWRDMATLNLGQSLITQRPVWVEVAHHLGATLRLSAAALAVALAVGLPLGLWAGLRPGSWADRASWALAVVLRGTPPFLLSVLLMLLVAVHWGFLPVAGDDESASLTRSAMQEVAQSPAFEFARTKGLTDMQAMLRHGLRAAAVPVVAYLGVQTLFLVEGALVVETVFAWPGIGHALVHAIFGRDIPIVQGAALAMALMFVLFNLLLDAACVALDPRQQRKVAA